MFNLEDNFVIFKLLLYYFCLSINYNYYKDKKKIITSFGEFDFVLEIYNNFDH